MPIFFSTLLTPSSSLLSSPPHFPVGNFCVGFSLLHLSLFSSSSSKEDMADCSRGDSYGSAQGHEDASSGKKYGGLMPKKKPLITKDHARAFFDSADWALGKQGAVMNQESTVPMETLRPKLQRTPHQRLPPRRPACTSGRDGPAD